MYNAVQTFQAASFGSSETKQKGTESIAGLVVKQDVRRRQLLHRFHLVTVQDTRLHQEYLIRLGTKLAGDDTGALRPEDGNYRLHYSDITGATTVGRSAGFRLSTNKKKSCEKNQYPCIRNSKEYEKYGRQV